MQTTYFTFSLCLLLSACGNSKAPESTSDQLQKNLHEQSLQVACDTPKSEADPIVYTSAETCGKTNTFAIDTDNRFYKILSSFANGRYNLVALDYPYSEVFRDRSALAFHVYMIRDFPDYRAGKKILNTDRDRAVILGLFSDGRVRLEKLTYPYAISVSRIDQVGVETAEVAGIRAGMQVLDTDSRVLKVIEVYSNNQIYAEHLAYPYSAVVLSTSQVSPQIR